MLIDAHLHLQDISDPDLCARLLSQSRQFNLGKFFCDGIRPDDWIKIKRIAAGDDRVMPFWGVHPWFADKVSTGWDAELERFLGESKSGIGEIGLDKLRKEVDFDKQMQVFQRQLEIAKHLSKPFVVHCVRAWGETLALLKKYCSPGMKCMMHSYRGSREMMREFLDLGAFISFSWKSFQHQRDTIRDLVREVPMDRLFLETDFPYLEPHKIGTDIRIERYFDCLQEVYEFAAQAKGSDRIEIEKAVWENGKAFLH